MADPRTGRNRTPRGRCRRSRVALGQRCVAALDEDGDRDLACLLPQRDHADIVDAAADRTGLVGDDRARGQPRPQAMATSAAKKYSAISNFA